MIHRSFRKFQSFSANIVDPDKTASKEQSDHRLFCLPSFLTFSSLDRSTTHHGGVLDMSGIYTKYGIPYKYPIFVGLGGRNPVDHDTLHYVFHGFQSPLADISIVINVISHIYDASGNVLYS